MSYELPERAVKHIEWLNGKIEKLESTLQFYANEQNYDSRFGLAIMKDCGDKARKGVEEMKETQTAEQNIIDQLHALGEYDTHGKSIKKLSEQLALAQIKAEAPEKSWF